MNQMTNEEFLRIFVEELDSDIDMLVGINNKVDYNENYDNGYNDAAVAIRNTVHTLYHKMTR